MRKISTTMAVMGLLVPMGANALGVGDIKLHSALNQLLNAEIPLVTSGSESISEVRVNLASPEAFSRAGIDRHYALSKLRFNPLQKPDGSYVIKVSSQDVIREPFLNFLLEVNWPQGRLFREFTVLLDPPATFEEPVVNTPDLPETDQTSSSFDPFNTQSTASSRMDRGSSYRRTTSRASVEGRISGSVFGPVRRNETLWNIARLVNRDPSITHEQMAIALYHANPHAFYQDSVNALKAGEKLKIPDRGTILSLSPQEAKTQFYQQAHAGKLSPRSAEKPQAEANPVSAEGGQQPQAQLKLEAPSDSKTSTESAVADSREDASKTKSDIALEVADTVKQENAEIRSRLAELEQQLSSMQRILSLKDAEIASLVQSREPQNVPQATPPGPTAVPEIPKPITPTTTPEPSQATVAPESAPITPPEPPKASPQPPTTLKPQALPTPAPEDHGLLSELLDEPFYLVVGGGGTLILGLIVWLAMRRRASMIEEMESILAASEMVKPQKTVTPPPLMDETPSEQLSTATKSSFLSEFTPSDFDALGGGADEVDPISEADVYLAYGRYKQAEELIRSAIEQHPARDECKLKLLEIHYATENKKAFEDYAKELFDQDKDSDPNFWDKVVEMGRELCPESSLFTNTFVGGMSANDETAIRSGSRGLSTDSLDLDDDLIADLRRFEQMHRQPTSETETNPAKIAAPIANDVASGLALSAQNEDDSAEEFPSLQFDLSPRNKDEVAESVSDGEIALDFDNLIQFETSKQPSAVNSSSPTQRDKTLDDILLELGAKSEREQASTSTSSQTIDKTKDGLDFDLELMSPPQTITQEDTELSLAPNEVEYADLTDMDEHETRLDLAKAYVDMGDNKTALEILEDVARKGNETQKREAKTWLDRLAKT